MEESTDTHNIAEILLKVALNTINQIKPTLNTYRHNKLLFHFFKEQSTVKTCLNQTPMGLKNLFSLDRFQLHRHLVEGIVKVYLV